MTPQTAPEDAARGAGFPEQTPQASLIEVTSHAAPGDTKQEAELSPSKKEDTAQHPVYFMSTVLRDAPERYTMQQKLL